MIKFCHQIKQTAVKQTQLFKPGQQHKNNYFVSGRKHHMKRKVVAAGMAAFMAFSVMAGTGATIVKADDEVTLKVFSNLPDRKNGQGLVEQMIIDDYMEENPNVKIEVEALDEEAYKTKFKAYSMEGMPDVVSIWGQPAFLDEVLDAGVLAELNQDDYKDYGFISGSLDGFMKDGKLYGLPRNTDVAGFYYNQKMFEDNGWENGVGMSAQDQSAYMTGDETELQMQFVDAVNNATSVSGTPINDCGPSAFKTSIESEIQSVSNGSVSVDDFLAAIGEACK